MADVIGTPDDEELFGTPDADFITGEGGNDTIYAGAGDDSAFGEDGDDVIFLDSGFDFGYGGAGDDYIDGGSENDNLFGEATGETINGIVGNDTLLGGDGDDFMRGGLGDDYMDGGAGSDRASFYATPNAVHVDLRIQGSAQNTGAGFDTLVNVENVAGSEFGDTLIGNDGANWFWTHGGGDNIKANAGDDVVWLPEADGATLDGGQGVDIVSFQGRIDVSTTGITFDLGQSGAQDTGRGLVTAKKFEGAEGSIGDDVIEGRGQADLLSGAQGADVVNALGGDDLIRGDTRIREVGEIPFSYDDPGYVQGADTLNGGAGDDAIYGEGGDDVIDGGAGHDAIHGGAGADRLIGAGGEDTFIYSLASESSGAAFDTIVGFNFKNGDDLIDLPNAVTTVSQVTGGTLDVGSFDANLAVEMNAGVLSAGEAVLFRPTSGSYAGEYFIVADGNGVAGYQSGADFVIKLEDPAKIAFFGTDDFI